MCLDLQGGLPLPVLTGAEINSNEYAKKFSCVADTDIRSVNDLVSRTESKESLWRVRLY